MGTPSPVYRFKRVKHGTQNIQNDCHQWVSDSFRVHQIRFRPGLRPEPHWRSLHRSPDPLAGLRGPISKGEGRERGKGEKKGKGRKWEGPLLSQIPRSAPEICLGQNSAFGVELYAKKTVCRHLQRSRAAALRLARACNEHSCHCRTSESQLNVEHVVALMMIAQH